MKQSTLEDGGHENFNSIYQAELNEFTSFSSGQSDLKLFNAYKEASGSCFVTLSTKHFVQIGGSSGSSKILGPRRTEAALQNVKLFSYENRQLFEHGHSRSRMNQAHQQVRVYH